MNRATLKPQEGLIRGQTSSTMAINAHCAHSRHTRSPSESLSSLESY